MKNAFSAAALVSFFSIACHAATPAPVPQNLLACSKLQDPAERVRCYDAQIAAMISATAPTPAPGSATASARPAAPAAVEAAHAAPAVPPAATASPGRGAPPRAPAVAASDRSRAAEFGQEQLPQAERPANENQSLSSRITALNALGASKYVISLENGQVWRQSESDHIASLFRVGDDVRIERGSLGSYHLWAASMGQKNWILVMRMR